MQEVHLDIRIFLLLAHVRKPMDKMEAVNITVEGGEHAVGGELGVVLGEEARVGTSGDVALSPSPIGSEWVSQEVGMM